MLGRIWTKFRAAVRKSAGYFFMGLSILFWGASLAVAWPFRALYKLCDKVVKKCLEEE